MSVYRTYTSFAAGFVVLAAVLAGCPAREAVVPDVVGMSQAEAEAALLAAGVTVGAVEAVYSDLEPEGAVARQVPLPGLRVASGTAVSLDVSMGPAPVPEARKVVPVGVVLPLTGAWSTVGQSANVTLATVLGTVNTYLRDSGLQLEPLVYDSNSDPAEALRALQALDRRGVRAVIGPLTSAEASAMLDYANAREILLMSPSSTATSLSLPDQLIRFMPSDRYQADALARALAEGGYTQVLPVCLDDVYGRDLAAAVSEAADARDGLEVLEAVTYDADVTDFAAVVAEVTAAAAGLSPETGAVLLIGRDTDAVALFRAAGLGSPLAGLKWFCGDGIAREAALLGDAEAAAFAAATGLEGFAFSWSSSRVTVPKKLAATLSSTALGASPSPSTVLLWSMGWFLGETLRVYSGSTADLTAHFVETVDLGVTAVAGRPGLDENGDILTAIYGRYEAVPAAAGGARWASTGEYLNHPAFGTMFLHGNGDLTEESGVAVIGAVLPLTGRNAASGTAALAAMKLAVRHANTYASLVEGLDIRFALDVRDSRSERPGAWAGVDALKARGVTLVTGLINSEELSAVREYINDNDMIGISTNSTAPSLAQPDYLMRLTPDDTHTARALARLVTAREKDIVIEVHIDDAYGTGFADAFAQEYGRVGKRVFYEPGTTDFSDVLAELEDAVNLGGADTAVLLVGLDETVTLLEQVPEGVLREVDWFTADIARREILASPAAREVALQTRLTSAVYDVAGKRTFVHMLKVVEGLLEPALGGPMTWNEMSAYDAVWLAAGAHLLTGVNPGSAALWDVLHSPTPPDAVCVAGYYTFDENDDQTNAYYAFYTPLSAEEDATWYANAYYVDIPGATDQVTLVTKRVNCGEDQDCCVTDCREICAAQFGLDPTVPENGCYDPCNAEFEDCMVECTRGCPEGAVRGPCF